MWKLSTGQLVTLACTLEAVAPKPGNVHGGAEFDDLSLEELLAAAIAIGPPMDDAVDAGVGTTVLRAVEASRGVTRSNANLGMILLIAPLAAVPRGTPLSEGVPRVLSQLGPEDAGRVYEAIRLAAPGGLGQVSQHDVRGPAPDSLLEAMRLASERDMIAEQYATDYQTFFDSVLPCLQASFAEAPTTQQAIVHAQLRLMAQFPDSLIARKLGREAAEEASLRAERVLQAGPIGSDPYRAAVADFDHWLRGDSSRRNPGTTADLIAAALFARLRSDIDRAPLAPLRGEGPGGPGG